MMSFCVPARRVTTTGSTRRLVLATRAASAVSLSRSATIHPVAARTNPVQCRRALCSEAPKPWLEDRERRPKVSREELNHILEGNISSTIDWAKEEDFLTELRQSAYATTGPTHIGQLFEAVVVAKEEKGVHVDYGGKFNAWIRMGPKSAELKTLDVGSRIVIDLKTPEATDHLLGESKHVSIHTALGKFVSTISTSGSAQAE
eukprot:m.440473 g.440473  ORF g.440473 m.440473 type:complete len:203 (+) comp18524_c0_seq1:86-694(+)